MPLKHLWSLAIEEQFYIFFPVILVTLLLTIKKRYKIGFIFWGVSIISLGLMMFIYSINGIIHECILVQILDYRHCYWVLF